VGVGGKAVRGLAAGFAGTVALTLSQRIEMRLTGRPPSDLPARVAEGILGIAPTGRRRELVGTAAHWCNNTASGLGRVVLDRAGLRGTPAAAAGFALYLGGSALLFARLGLAPPPWRRPPRELAIEAVHAAVWAGVTNAAYELMAPAER
jgi:hypothetical protein